MESYNIKTIEYADGTTQIKIYDGLVRPHKKRSKQLLTSECERPEKPPVIEMSLDEIIESMERNEKEKKQREEYSLRSSVSRTRTKIQQLARSGEFTHFMTLTYSPTKVDRYNYDECIKKFTNWVQNIKKVSPKIQILAVPEYHLKTTKIDSDGNEILAVHFHGLIGHIEGLQLEFYRMRHGCRVYKLIDWRFGISDVTEIENRDAICKYMTKYINKQLISIARTQSNRHRYFKTGLTAPKETTALINGNCKDALQDQYIQRYAERNNMDVCRTTNYSEHGYIPVKYVELKPKS